LFGDGGSSGIQHPAHTYSSPGVYTVNLTTGNSGGNSTKSVPGLINATSIPISPPVANFTVNRTSGPVPLTVQFTDTSTGSPDYWSWLFGDGGSSGIQHPVHTYSSPGVYTVNLTTGNAGGNSTKSVPGLINATSPPGHTITASAGTGGSIYPSGTVTVVHGGNQTFTITPDSEYQVSAVQQCHGRSPDCCIFQPTH
jgi:PKD repeat protein